MVVSDNLVMMIMVMKVMKVLMIILVMLMSMTTTTTTTTTTRTMMMMMMMMMITIVMSQSRYDVLLLCYEVHTMFDVCSCSCIILIIKCESRCVALLCSVGFTFILGQPFQQNGCCIFLLR